MSRVVTFGEIMLRLAPNGYFRFFQNDQMQATFGGGEANVAVSLANFGVDISYVTKLPDNCIGDGAVAELRKFGVDTSYIIRGGNRMGIYFLKKVLVKEEVFVFTIEHIQRFRKLLQQILIGIRYLRERGGFILPGLHQLWERILLKSVRLHAVRQRKKD